MLCILYCWMAKQHGLLQAGRFRSFSSLSMCEMPSCSRLTSCALALVTLLLAVGWLSARVMFLLPYGSPAHITQTAPVVEGEGFSKLFGRASCKSGTWCLGIVNLVINAISEMPWSWFMV